VDPIDSLAKMYDPDGTNTEEVIQEETESGSSN